MHIVLSVVLSCSLLVQVYGRGDLSVYNIIVDIQQGESALHVQVFLYFTPRLH